MAIRQHNAACHPRSWRADLCLTRRIQLGAKHTAASNKKYEYGDNGPNVRDMTRICSGTCRMSITRVGITSATSHVAIDLKRTKKCQYALELKIDGIKLDSSYNIDRVSYTVQLRSEKMCFQIAYEKHSLTLRRLPRRKF